MSGIMNIGLRSLMAYQSAIQTAAQNLENSHTPFYSRRQISFVESMFNGGVEIGDVNRVYDEVANKSLLRSGSNLYGINKYLEGVSDLERLLDSDSTSINQYLNDSLTSLQELTKDVNSSQMRGSYLSKLSNIANQFRTIGSEITRKKSELNTNINTTVGFVNDLVKRIADISTQINQTKAGERDSLLDQRNGLVHELSKYFNFDTTTDSNDCLSITLSNGLEVLSQGSCNQFTTVPDSADATKLTIQLNNGAVTSDATPFITGGELSGLLRNRNEALDSAERGLARLSLVLSSAFNTQNKLGVDGNGDLGSNIFTDINDSSMRAGRVVANTRNVGSASIDVTIEDTNLLSTSDYKLVFTDATHYSLTRLNDNSVVKTGEITSYPATIDADGFNATISTGSFSQGDSFIIKPTVNAMQNMNVKLSDPTKLALGFPVYASSGVTNTGDGKITVDKITDTSGATIGSNKQLNPPLKIEFLTDTTYQILDANTSAVIEGPINYDGSSSIFPTPGGYDPGYRLSLSGSVKAGDTFSTEYNTNLAGDNRNALLFSNLYTDKYLDNGNLSLSQSYGKISNDVSMKANMAKSAFESALSRYNQADLHYNQISGVSNIEEMADLANYQESYQASAQVIQIAKTIFDTIISLSR